MFNLFESPSNSSAEFLTAQPGLGLGSCEGDTTSKNKVHQKKRLKRAKTNYFLVVPALMQDAAVLYVGKSEVGATAGALEMELFMSNLEHWRLEK